MRRPRANANSGLSGRRGQPVEQPGWANPGTQAAREPALKKPGKGLGDNARAEQQFLKQSQLLVKASAAEAVSAVTSKFFWISVPCTQFSKGFSQHECPTASN